MRKLLILLLALMVMITACGDKDKEETNDEQGQVTSNDSEEDGKDKGQDKGKDSEEGNEAQEDSDSEVKDINIDKVTIDELSKYVTYDASLTGQALIDSVEYNDIDSILKDLYMKVEMTMVQSNGQQDMEYNIFAYGNDKERYTEYGVDGQKTIMIELVVDDMLNTYTYVEGETEGYLEKEPYEEMVDTVRTSSDIYEEGFGNLVECHVEIYEGYEVIYTEVEDGGFVTRQWFLPALGGPIKDESYLNGELTSTMAITNFELLKSMDQSLLEIPANVTFSEF